MLEAALFRHDRIPCDSLNRRLHRVAFEIGDANGVFVNDGNLAVAEEKDVSCVLENRWNIRSDEKLAVAKTDNDGRSLPHSDNRIRFVCVDDRKRKDAT